MRLETKSRHSDRISAAVTALETRLDNPPTARELASVAAMSPYHFHRVYRALTGETVQETVRRLRIARAIAMLREEGATVTDVALAVGYESSQAFAKAFRAMTGASASEARAHGLDALAEKLARPQTPAAPTVEIQVIAVEPFKVAAITRTGRPEELAHGYRALLDHAIELGVGDQLQGVYGVPADDPYETPIEMRGHVCCMTFGVETDRMPAGDISVMQITGRLYARARHVGRYEDIDDAYLGIYAAIASSGGYEFADAPVFTTYVDTPEDAPPEKRRVDLHVPIVLLSEEIPA